MRPSAFREMKRSNFSLFRYLSALWVSGAAALALATWACWLLGLTSATAACVYLVVIVLLSLMDSFVTAAIFPVIAVACLDFFFIEPLFAFEVANPQDLATHVAFLVTSIVITSLVRRLRRLGQAQQHLHPAGCCHAPGTANDKLRSTSRASRSCDAPFAGIIGLRCLCRRPLLHF